VLWVAALLSSLLALEFLFRDDAQDGTLEQHVLSGQSLTWLLFAKTVAHWLLTGLPLAVMAAAGGAVARCSGGRVGRHRLLVCDRQCGVEFDRVDRRRR